MVRLKHENMPAVAFAPSEFSLIFAEPSESGESRYETDKQVPVILYCTCTIAFDFCYQVDKMNFRLFFDPPEFGVNGSSISEASKKKPEFIGSDTGGKGRWRQVKLRGKSTIS